MDELNDKCTNKHKQLCWDCKKATGGCSWADRLEPVEGWTAVQVDRSGWNNPDKGYDIYECPLFEEGDILERGLASKDGVREMLAAVVKDALMSWDNLRKRYDPKDVWFGNVKISDHQANALRSEILSLTIFFNSKLFESYVDVIDSSIDVDWIKERYHIPDLDKRRKPIFKEGKC